MTHRKQFFKFVLPSVAAMLVSALYSVVDGIFVGRGVGADALAAINISVPFISIMLACAMMLSMGGATLTSIYLGKNDPKKANQSFITSLSLVVIFSLILSIISVVFPESIARLMGASEGLVQDTATYIKYYVMFGIFFCASLTLSAFIRNDKNPNLAFWGMVAGAITNIFLDWLFIFPLGMGIAGAAIASGLGQLVSCLILSTHFIFKKGTLRIQREALDLALIKEIIRVGSPEFITQMNQPVTILCYNLIVLEVLGAIGISAFSVVCYLLIIILAVFIGVSQGVQPLISRSFGEEDYVQQKFYFKQGLILNSVLSVSVYLIMVVFGKPIISVFNQDPQLIAIAYESILVYGISFVFAAVNIIYTTYYLATKHSNLALTIAILRSFILNSICIFLFPMVFGPSMLWVGIIAAELIGTLIAIGLSKRSQKSVTSQHSFS